MELQVSNPSAIQVSQLHSKTMKKLIRYVAVAAVVSTMALAQSAFAGECCKKAAANTKAGKTCAKELAAKCCKDASAKVAKAGEAKSCEKCASAKSNEKKS